MLYDPKWEADTALSVLTRARTLIENEENWSPQGWGRSQGKYCAIRAVCTAFGRGEHIGGDAQDILTRIVGQYFGEFNDTHTHAQVLATFDRAIELAGGPAMDC